MALTDELFTFRCDGSRDGRPCGAEYTGKPHEVHNLGWQRKPLKHRREFWLCGDCIKHLDPIWHPEEKAA